MRKHLVGVAVFVAVLAGWVGAQEVMTNETVIRLHEMGLGPQVLVTKVQTTESTFDTSVESLSALKTAGVPDEVIAAMIAASASDQTEPEFDPNDPLAPHPPGIYLWSEGEGESRMLLLEPSVYTQSRSGGFMKSALTYGIAKIKSRAVLPGTKARLPVTTARPTFYFYFEELDTGLSYQTQGSTNPGEFVLAEFTVKHGKGHRELVVGKIGALGSQSGASQKAVKQFDYERLAPGIYKVVTQNLEDGEYCFYYAGSAALPTYGYTVGGGGKVFDFSVSLR